MYHSVNPESWFASTPGLKIVAPITAFDAKGLLKAAIHDDNPVLYLEYKAFYRVKPDRLPRELDVPVPDDDYIVPIGTARVVKEGRDLTLIAYGSQLVRALDAAHQLEQQDGVSVEVIDLRTIVPYDSESVERSVRKTNRALVTCEAPQTGCFGATVVTDIVRNCFEYLDAPVRLVAAADTPVPFAPGLEKSHLPTTEKLVATMRQIIAY
jgi:pyruvate/2-oxoglutarate/acetoin dehydrogenase E1 component